MPLLVPPGSRSGYVSRDLTGTTESTFTTDRDQLVREIRFVITNAPLTTQTVKVTAEGQQLFATAGVRIAALNSAWSNGASLTAQNGVVIWRPDTPIAWTQSFPIYITTSVDCTVVLMADPVIPPQAAR